MGDPLSPAGRQNPKHTLGSYPKLDLKAAREAAEAALASVDRGEDPSALKRQQRVGEAANGSFSDCVARYSAACFPKMAPKTTDTVKRQLGRACELWGQRPLASIKRSEIIEAARAASDKYGESTGRTFLKWVKSFYLWCALEELCDASPAALIPLKHIAKEVRRDRVLSDAELSQILKAADFEGGSFAAAIRLLLLTACRRNEILELRRREINGVKIVLPKERVKTGRETGKGHVLPLSDGMRKALALVKYDALQPEEFVLPSSRPGVHVHETTLKKAVDSSIKGDIAPWTLHDLRRTASTRMNEIGILPHVVERILNHSKKGIEGTYNLAGYDDEVKSALDKWSKHVAKL